MGEHRNNRNSKATAYHAEEEIDKDWVEETGWVSEDLTLKSMKSKEMPEELDNAGLTRFLEDYVDSFVKWDIITFSCMNPSTSATAEDIARYLGRKEKDVEQALEDLVKRNLFQKKPGDKPLYEYSPSEDLKRLCLRFVKCLEERDSRLKIVAKLLKLQRR